MIREYVQRSKQLPRESADSKIVQRTGYHSKQVGKKAPQRSRGKQEMQLPGRNQSEGRVQPVSQPKFKGLSHELRGDRSLENIVLPIQAKLTIGQGNDKYEQEADRVASMVVQQINTPGSTQSSQGQSVQRQSELEITSIQRRQNAAGGQDAIASGEATPEFTSALESALLGGQPLDGSLQQSMGQAMGADFSGVRVHTDARSDQLNKSIQAKAFTTGHDVFFRQGEYQPGSRGGQETIAHELTHVVQQNGRTVQGELVQRNGDDDRKKKNQLEPSKFRSQYVRDAIRDAEEARKQGMTVEEFRTQKQEERLKGFRASLTGLYPEELEQLREDLNAARVGLERDRAQMIEILEEENLILQIAIAPDPGAYITELGEKASSYRQQEQRSKKKGLKKIFESKESKAKRKAEKASAAQIAEEYEEQALLGKSHAKRLARIRALVKMVRPNEDMSKLSESEINRLAEYVNEQIETAGSFFDVSHLQELASNLKDEPIVRTMEKIMIKGGIQSLHKRREENDKIIELFQKDLKEFSLGTIGRFIENLGPKENKEERERRLEQGQEMLEKALKQREEINKMIELSQDPRYQERAERYEKDFQRLERLTKQKEARNK